MLGGAWSTLLACLPLLAITIPGVLPGATYTPGSLQVLALALLTGALALSYHLLFGVAGLLSFGHALYFAAGVYGLAVVLERTDLPLLPAGCVVLVGGILLANVLGAISLRVTGISFAMVTLAFPTGRQRARAPQPGPGHRRRGGSGAAHRARARRPGGRDQHAQPLLARARRARPGLPGRPLGAALARRSRRRRHARERDAGPRARRPPVRDQAPHVRHRRDTRHGCRHGLPAAAVGRGAAHQLRGLHPRAAGHGRGAVLGRVGVPSSVAWSIRFSTSGSGRWPARRRSPTCRPCCECR